MLTYKQSVVLLISIITVLAIIAIVTGLSPLYWPRPKNIHSQSDNSSSVNIATNQLVLTMLPTNATIKSTTKSQLTTSSNVSNITIPSKINNVTNTTAFTNTPGQAFK